MASPSPILPAATIILLREAGGAPEMLMVRRTRRMAFAAGAWVWPGGRIDDHDHTIEGAAPYQVAALRELVEEVGLAAALSPHPTAAQRRELQSAFLGGASVKDELDRHELTLQPDKLLPFARWAPNLDLKRRFDTWFLIARADGDDTPLSLQEGEVAEASWTTAAAMLDRIAAGEAHAIFPTMRNLERLAAFDTIEALFTDTAGRTVEKIVPWIEDRGGVEHICIPENAGYPVTAVPTEEAFRGEH
ncbi:NUDIX hydrolase [Sphingomicrobium sediminis]|uniref:NUDIX domain-containing protein n=1 Tax=Sphingomicrobium sediminis TaxID=2950949 RepID=A0A9X2EGY1_9SPHN|nr:NUDIX domain-containing protein [Sphingomicrobium sediminis]MCM8557315.1 NUDIX domain-containing protein [Sphingomicrobium sediminis]